MPMLVKISLKYRGTATSLHSPQSVSSLQHEYTEYILSLSRCFQWTQRHISGNTAVFAASRLPQIPYPHTGLPADVRRKTTQIAYSQRCRLNSLEQLTVS